MNTLASIRRQNVLGYLSLDIICSSKLTVFLELHSRKAVRFSEQTMSADKCPSIFSRQIEAIVYIHKQAHLGECVYQENTRDEWDITRYTTRKRGKIIVYHAIEKNSGQRSQNDTYARRKIDGKVGCNTVEYTTAFLYSDWLYFLWHGIDINILYKVLISNKKRLTIVTNNNNFLSSIIH